MDLKNILTISGHSGLFKHVAQSKTGIIVESLEDKKRTVVYIYSKINSLQDIAVFLQNGEMPLHEIFKQIFEKENGNLIFPNAKPADKELKEYFASIIPNYDRSRVYLSDMKRMISWYNILQKNSLLDFSEAAENEKITQ